MQEKIDGSFGDIKHGKDLHQLMNDQMELMNTRAIHFGTVEELEAIVEARINGHSDLKEGKTLEQRLSTLEEEFEKIKPARSSSILIPTDAQIKRYAKKIQGR